MIPRISRAYDIFSNYYDCHAHAMHTLQNSVVRDDIKEKIVGEIQANLDEAKKVLNGPFRQEYSDVVRAVNHKRAKYYVLVQLI